jgi:hypothetical protein
MSNKGKEGIKTTRKKYRESTNPITDIHTTDLCDIGSLEGKRLFSMHKRRTSQQRIKDLLLIVFMSPPLLRQNYITYREMQRGRGGGRRSYLIFIS